MKNGDEVVLVTKQAGKPGSRLVLKELLIKGNDVFAVTTPATMPDWPNEIQLRPEHLEASPMLSGRRELFFYQDDVVKP